MVGKSNKDVHKKGVQDIYGICKHLRASNNIYRLKLLSKGNLLGDNHEINIT